MHLLSFLKPLMLSLPRGNVHRAIRLLAVAITLLSPGAGFGATDLPLQTADCIDFINERPARVTCGFLDLPQVHGTSSENGISLPVLVARAGAAKSRHAVLIPGGGGPGSPVGFGYLYERGDFLEAYEGLLRAGIDVVVVDQRGAGLASPHIGCPEAIEAFYQTAEQPHSLRDEFRTQQRAMQRCKTRLEEQRITLSAFDTRQSALDFLAIMKTLRYEQWSAIATSYATVIAQAMLIEQPRVFASLVLDSPVPLDYQQPLTDETSYSAISKTITLCERTACTGRYPDLRRDFDDLLESTQRSPFTLQLSIEGDDGYTSTRKLIVNRTTLLNILLTAIYSTDYLSELPALVTRVSRGNRKALLFYAEDFWYQNTDLDYADALHLTVHCKERQLLEKRYLKSNPRYLETLSADSRFYLQAQQDLCRQWEVAEQNNLLPGKPFPTRTLIIAGALDPVISDADISHTADNFNNAQLLTITNAGHSVTLQSACAQQYTTEFIRGLDTAADCDSASVFFK